MKHTFLKGFDILKQTEIEILTLFSCVILIACSDHSELSGKLEGEAAGGDATIYISNTQAFGTPAPNLSADNLEKHQDGDIAFEATFVSSPSPKNGGLGPVFNNNSCNACHPSDGRASFPEDINAMSGFFLRISIPGTDEHGGPNPVPGFGTQLQHQALFGYEPEAELAVQYEAEEVTLSDGVVVELQKPKYSIVSPYQALPDNVLISPRIGMPVFGLGLLEAIEEEDILYHQDSSDIDGDGISGKANYVWDPVTTSIQLGRFGWKAGAASVLAQSAGAYSGDMGITSSIHPVPTSYGQSNGEITFDSMEVSDEDLEAVRFYCMTLAVPAGRNYEDRQVIQGNKLFKKLHCDACHIPTYTTGVVDAIPAISGQKIYPYTDLLLHDMGEELADNRSEYMANGKEWKTRPLWGIGLTSITSGHTSLLHDGRARNITEAIVWHGGEAKEARNAFIQLSTNDREALLAFLNAL